MFHVKHCYDVIIIGGGHAGCEAAAVAARMGGDCLLVTHRIDGIGEMSCNPAIGGLGKGHLVREIDAFGGIMGLAGDRSAIQFRLLNRSKGQAVQGPRVQSDRKEYKTAIAALLCGYDNLTLLGDTVIDLVLDHHENAKNITGVVTQSHGQIAAKAVILTTGTFLQGMIHIGTQRIPAGRMGDKPDTGLSQRLQELGLATGRLKTGTPARLLSETIDFDALAEQPGDQRDMIAFLSTRSIAPTLTQVPCHITHTNAKTHAIIRDHIGESAQYSGQMEALGPRYCPSIEDKIMRFLEKQSHQIFLEPEGLDSNWIYPNGLSSSLPEELQRDFLRSIKGLECVEFARPGYAIAYDYIDPRQLLASLECKACKNLFFAGQINGTTGYEEAAAQGLIAGINAILRARSLSAYFPDRTTSYIGVMIDDLVHRGADEPYRMFTSRSEYRLRLRPDNADQRLSPVADQLGCLDPTQQKTWHKRHKLLQGARQFLENKSITPPKLVPYGIAVRQDGCPRSAFALLELPHVTCGDLQKIWPKIADWDDAIKRQLEIEARYHSYIQRQEGDVATYHRDQQLRLPKSLDYRTIAELSNEAREKLHAARPDNIASAARIPGVTPAAIMALMRFVKRGR
ncbi:MAG: tRNA uridine-5-carboxymethylaminomethyl(34) synthesis enzyme MnmG [Pseudomonadota bacterium]